MKVHNSVKLELSKEELDAVQAVYNMLYEIDGGDEIILNHNLCGASVEDVRTLLADLWEFSGHDIDTL